MDFNALPAESDPRQNCCKVLEQTFYILRNPIQTDKKLKLSRPLIDKKREDEEQCTHGIRKLGHIRGAIKSGLRWTSIRW